MVRLKHAARAALLVVLAACAADGGSPTAPQAPAGAPVTVISDAARGGPVPGFYFLPPTLWTQPSYSGTFDPALQPRVVVCELAGSACGPTIVQFNSTSGTLLTRVRAFPLLQHYIVYWNTAASHLDPAKTYRIRVFVDSLELGFADVDVVRRLRDLAAVDTSEYAPLLDDLVLPIRFRIEKGIARTVTVSPDSASVNVGGTQQFTAAVTDLHGNPLPGAPVTWSSGNPAVATVSSTGLATGVAPGSTAITATSGAASDNALLHVVDPNTPPVAAPDTFQAIGNVTVPVAAPGVLANDTDDEDNPVSAVAGTFPTASGGTVTIAADGGFSYLSAAGFTGADSFTYTATDGTDSASATVTIVSPYRVWYVDNAAAAPGDGRDASPFATLKAAESASAAGETVFLRSGNGTSAGYDEGIVLKTGQSLTGQGVPSDVTATLNGATVVLLPAGAAPAVTRSGAGTTIQLSVNNVVQGIDVGSSAGAGIGGSGFGTLTVGAVSVAANGGPALDLSSGDVFGSFASLSSASSTGAGIRLVGIGGGFSAAGGSVSGAGTAGVEVTGGGGAFSYGGGVAVTGVPAVSVTGRTGGALAFAGTIAATGHGIVVTGNGGGTIAFTGASKTLAGGANPGVRLENNGGAAVSFGGGGLAISTSGATGFLATGGGTVTVTGAGNSIGTTGAAALRVDGATIGGAGLSFRSVGASGGANGIFLRNTGNANGLQVTGTGAAGSGGAITGLSGADATTGGIGVYLEDVRNVSLNHMALSGFDNYAIRGVGVSGFELDGTVVSGTSGTSGALDEAAVAFDGLTGAARVASSSISGGVEDNFRVVNTSGTLDRLTITGTTFGANSTAEGGSAVYVEGSGSAVVNVTVQGSDFDAARAHLVRVNLLGSARSDVVLSANSFVNGHPVIIPGAGGVVLEGTGGATELTYAITGNTFRGALGSALAVQEGAGTGTFSGTVSDNVIGAAGVANSGSAQGSGISLTSVGGGSHTVRVTGNQVRQYNNQGVLLQIGDAAAGGDGSLNATVTGNVIAEPGTAPSAKNGIHLNAGLITGDNPQVCVDLGGPGALANAITGSGSGGAAGTDFRLRQRMATTVRLPGYAGGNADNAAVTAYVQGRNGGTPTGLAQNTVSTGGGGFTGGSACAQQ
jgi:Bacterial Ig-like domain (group 2)/Cadherin-like domain